MQKHEEIARDLMLRFIERIKRYWDKDTTTEECHALEPVITDEIQILENIIGLSHDEVVRLYKVGKYRANR